MTPEIASLLMYQAKAYGQNGRRVAETADTACTSGTTFAYRLKTANNKNVPIYGAAITVH